MRSEKPFTLNDRNMGRDAFGLYLVLGILLALIVVLVFAVLESYNKASVREPAEHTYIVYQDKMTEDAGAAERAVPEKVRNSSLSDE